MSLSKLWHRHKRDYKPVPVTINIVCDDSVPKGTVRFTQLVYGSPVIYAPRKNVVFINVKDDVEVV